LNSVHDLIQVLVEFEDSSGADAVGFNQLKNARLAHAHESKLGCCEKSVGCHQEHDEQHPEQHVGNHGISSFYLG
jgi:hypothetical protein